jgi:polyisoprenoid-binding protein YceI
MTLTPYVKTAPPLILRCDCSGKGPKARAGFAATTTINRHDFGVSWNSALDKVGVVVGNMVEITIDAEAILREE